MSGPRYPRLSSHFPSFTPILPHRSSHLLILEAFCDSPFALLQHALPIYRENILLIYQHQVFSLSVYIVTSTFLLILLYSMSYLFTALIGYFTDLTLLLCKGHKGEQFEKLPSLQLKGQTTPLGGDG